MNRQLSHAARVTVFATMMLIVVVANSAGADDLLVPRQQHEWGKFPVGSWKKVRLVTERLGVGGKVTSRNSSDTTTTVVEVDNNSVQLQLETVVEVAGKQFNKEPQTVTQGFGGEVNGGGKLLERLVKRVGTDNVEIDGRQFESEVRTITVQRPARRWTSRIHYCRNIAPYVLRREISAQDPSGGDAWYRTSVEVTAINVPQEVRGVMRSTSHVRTTHTTAKGTTITLEVRCEDVPGGFVSHTSQEFDAAGRLVGRSTLSLLDYEVSHQGPVQIQPVPRGPTYYGPVQERPRWSRWQQRRWSRQQ